MHFFFQFWEFLRNICKLWSWIIYFLYEQNIRWNSDIQCFYSENLKFRPFFTKIWIFKFRNALWRHNYLTFWPIIIVLFWYVEEINTALWLRVLQKKSLVRPGLSWYRHQQCGVVYLHISLFYLFILFRTITIGQGVTSLWRHKLRLKIAILTKKPEILTFCSQSSKYQYFDILFCLLLWGILDFIIFF